MDEQEALPKKKININLLLGLSAVFLSASALIVSIIQTTILREQQHASAWPYLQTQFSFASGSYSFGLENKGVGPAIIEDFEYTYKGSSYKDTRAVFSAVFGENFRGAGFSGAGENYVFKSGESISMLHVNLPDSLIREVIYRWESDSVKLKIIYSDVYGNCLAAG